MLGGIVTVPNPDELALFLRVPIALDPPRRSELVIMLSDERKYWVVEAVALLLPIFAVVSLIVKVLPVFLFAGGFPRLLTVRSG